MKRYSGLTGHSGRCADPEIEDSRHHEGKEKVMDAYASWLDHDDDAYMVLGRQSSRQCRFDLSVLLAG